MPNYPCILCANEVRPRQHAIQCDLCLQWQHRTCNTGIIEYRQIVRDNARLEWMCAPCSTNEAPPPDDVPTLDDTDDHLVLNDSSFNIVNSFNEPENIAERSLVDEAPRQPEYVNPDFTVLDGVTQRTKQKLVSNGYSYTVKRQRGNTIMWRCSIRNKTTNCSATVVQNGDTFVVGPKDHCHGPTSGMVTSLTVKAKIKEQAKNDLFQSGTAIVERVLVDNVDLQHPCEDMPGTSSLSRTANRIRAKLRPEEPRDLQFQLAEYFIPEGFLKWDGHCDDQRHIIFASDQQLSLLADAKRWYLDGTFKVVKKPFVQLFSIHAFLRADKTTKQVPLVFVLMSRRRTKDYKEVLLAIHQMLPRPASVLEFVADFEKGMWKGLRSVFEDPAIKGYCFHWSQAVWRKVQDLGLRQMYLNDVGTHRYIKKILALPFLPSEHISGAFDVMVGQATTTALVDLMEYIGHNWINSRLWTPSCWSVYNQSVRTNNDVEGWHRRLNHCARDAAQPLYRLIPLLHEEAQLVRHCAVRV